MFAAVAGSGPEEGQLWEQQCWGLVEVMMAEDRQRREIGQGYSLPS